MREKINNICNFILLSTKRIVLKFTLSEKEEALTIIKALKILNHIFLCNIFHNKM